jgi:hypothetical protein
MPKPAPCDDRRHQFLLGEDRPVGRLADDVAKLVHLFRSHSRRSTAASSASPTTVRRPSAKGSSGLLGCEQVERAPHGPGLDQASLGQGAADLAAPRLLAPNADRELGRRRALRLDTAETTDYPRDGRRTDRIQKMPLHPPGQSLFPGDPHRYAPSVASALRAASCDHVLRKFHARLGL